jgi:hypothetical protein
LLLWRTVLQIVCPTRTLKPLSFRLFALPQPPFTLRYHGRMEPDAKPTEATERRWPKLTAEERKQSID